MEQGNEKYNLLDKQRFETFIDAILAIVITFLILEFRVPRIEDATDAQLISAVRDMLPLFLCYIASFMAIVTIYLDYHVLFKHISEIKPAYAFINFLFILTVSILPFATGFAGEYIHSEFAIAFYCSCLLLMNVFFAFVFIYPMKNQLVGEKFFDPQNVKGSKISYIGLGMEVLSIPLAFVNPLVSILLVFIVMALHILKHII